MNINGVVKCYYSSTTEAEIDYESLCRCRLKRNNVASVKYGYARRARSWGSVCTQRAVRFSEIPSRA